MQDDLLTGFDLRKEPDCHHGVWPARPPGEIKPESLPHLPKKNKKTRTVCTLSYVNILLSPVQVA